MRKRHYSDKYLPLVWAKNIRAGGFCKPKSKAGDAVDFVRFDDETSAIIRTDALVLQRTTNSAQKRRLIAARIQTRCLWVEVLLRLGRQRPITGNLLDWSRLVGALSLIVAKIQRVRLGWFVPITGKNSNRNRESFSSNRETTETCPLRNRGLEHHIFFSHPNDNWR